MHHATANSEDGENLEQGIRARVRIRRLADFRSLIGRALLMFWWLWDSLLAGIFCQGTVLVRMTIEKHYRQVHSKLHYFTLRFRLMYTMGTYMLLDLHECFKRILFS